MGSKDISSYHAALDIFCSKCQLSIKNDFSSGLGEKLFNKDSFNTAPLASNQKVPHLSLLEPPNKSGAVELHQEIKFMVQTAESNPYVPQEKQNESCKVNSRNNCPLDYSKPVDYSMKLTISELNSKTKSDNLFGHLLDDIPLEDTRKNERESKPKESFELEKIETNSDKDHYVKNRIASAETAQNVCSMFENEAVQYPEICGKKDYKIDEIETDGVAITFPSVAVKIEDEFIDISAEHVVNDSTSIQIESSFSARIKSEPSSPISVSVNSEAVQNPRTELESEIYHSEPNSKAVSSLPETCEIGSIFAVLDSEINENQTTKLNSSEACKMLRIELVRCDTVKDVSISCSGSTEKVNKTAAKTHGKLKNLSYVKGKKDAKSKIVKSKSKKKNSKISHVVERDSFGANVKESKDDLNKNNTNARKKQLKLDNKGKIAKKKLDNGKNKKKNETKGSKEKYGNAKKVGDIESIPVKPIPASKSTTIDECPTNFGVVPNHGETALNHEAKSILPNDEKMVYSTKEIDKTLPSGSSNFYNSGMFSIPYTLSGVISSTESDQSTNTLLGNKKQTLAVQKPLKRTYSNFSSKKRKERDCHGYTRIKPKNTDILAPMPVESTTKSCSTISFTVSESLFNGKREKVKVYKCNLCECAFERKYDQLQHALRHTQQSQLLNCNLCTYTTQEELHLERHVTVVHKNTPCDVTDVVF